MEPPDARARLEALDAVFGALNHAARRQVLLTLHFRGGSMSAGEIAKRFSHAWPTTTRHLRVLEEAGLLTHERQGRTVVYRIDRSRLDLISQWLAWFGPNEEHDGESGTKVGGGDPRVRTRTPRRA